MLAEVNHFADLASGRAEIHCLRPNGLPYRKAPKHSTFRVRSRDAPEQKGNNHVTHSPSWVVGKCRVRVLAFGVGFDENLGCERFG